MDQFLDYLNITTDKSAWIALAQVILIDITLAGDNAIVIGMTASRVAPEIRKQVIFWGLVAAVVLRLLLAVVATKILAIIGLTLAGGILLLWVSWRLWRDIRNSKEEEQAGVDAMGDGHVANGKGHQYVTMGKAIGLITIADLSMSLDNVLAVAGAAMEHLWVLVLGLALSIALMGAAAVGIAKLLKKYPWISYVGLLIVVYVAARMIWEGSDELITKLHLW